METNNVPQEWNKFYLKDVSFVNLMTRRIFNVLIVANPYDAFMLEDDGRIDEKIFDEYMELEGDELKINGCVRWGYDDDEVVALLDCLKDVAAVTRLKLEYEELGCCLYGFYLYENGVLEDHYIPCSDFPDCDNDSYYEELERVLEEDGTVNVILAGEAA